MCCEIETSKLRLGMNKNTSEISYGEDQELLSQFIGWTENSVVEIRELVDAMPDDIARGDDSVNRIYDLTHNIKGMGASFEFDLLTSVGVSLCGYLKGMEASERIRRRVFEAHVRAMEVILEHKITGTGGDKGVALTNRLSAIIAEESLS